MKWLLELLGIGKKKKKGIRAPRGLQGLYEQAIGDAYNLLPKSHYPNVTPYAGEYIPIILRLPNHRWPGHGPEVNAVTFGTKKIEFQKGHEGNYKLIRHEFKHWLLYRAGYDDASNRHLPPAFRQGGRAV